jgi:hypothetical protein
MPPDLPVQWIVLALTVLLFTVIGAYTASLFFVAHSANAYREQMCPLVDSENPLVQATVLKAIPQSKPGKLSMSDYVRLFEWFNSKIAYHSDPEGTDEYSTPAQTLETQQGDCEDMALLAASMIRARGGTVRFMAVFECRHAFAMVPAGTEDDLKPAVQQILDTYRAEYQKEINASSIQFYRDDSGQYWLVFDPAGGSFLGDTYPACTAVQNLRFYC